MPKPQPPTETNQKQLHDVQDHKLVDHKQDTIDGEIQDNDKIYHIYMIKALEVEIQNFYIILHEVG